jgi:hypothetical protein
MPALVYNTQNSSGDSKQSLIGNELPFAKGGIKGSQLPPPKPLLIKAMPDIKLPPMPLPPQPK